MKLLITGAFGNLGLMCIEQALAMGHEVVCLDRKSRANQRLAASYSGKAETVLADLRDEASVRRAVNGVDAIIHNASVLPPLTETSPEIARDINVTACERLISIAEASPQSPVFIFPSSLTVFGLPEENETPRSSADAVHPTDNYTRHKIDIESALQEASIPWVILRVGVSVDARTLSTDRKTFRQLLAVEPNNRLEWVHPKDVALAMCRAAGSAEARNRILMIGGGSSCQITQREFLATAFDSLGIPLPASSHGAEPYYTHWLDTTESQALLEFQHHSFADYQTEMAARLAPLRTALTPLRPLLRRALPRILERL